MNENILRVLIADDDASLREELARYLRKHHNYTVDIAASGEEALSFTEAAGGHYNVALLDGVFPDGLNGLDVLKKIKARYAAVEVILFTAYGKDLALEAVRAGAYRYFAKPFDWEELALTIRIAAEQGQARRERQMLAALNKVSATINSTASIEEIRHLICQTAVELLGVDHSGLVEFEPGYSSGRVRAEYPSLLPSTNRTTLGTEIPVRDVPLMERLVSQKEVLNIPDVKNETLLGPVRDILSGFGIQSILMVPVVRQSRVVGSISLDAISQPRTFSQNEIELCQSLASQVSIAIENAQLFDRVVTLMSVGQILTTGLKLDEVLKQIVNYATLTLPTAERGAIHLYDAQTGILRLSVHTHYLGSAAIDALNLKPGEGIAGWVYQQWQAVVVLDAWADPRYKRIANREVPMHKSMICVPLRIKNRVIGTLSLTNTQATGVFQDDDLRLLSTFADQAATAIENARLLQEAQEGRDYLGSLYEASNQIISPGKPEAVLQEVVNNARLATGAYLVVALLFDEAEKPRVLAQSGGKSEKNIAEDVRPEGNSVKVIHSGQPLFIHHSNDPALLIPFNPRMIAGGTQAAACLPMLLMGKIIGVLWVDFDKPHAFSESERKALQLFATQSAIAYDNARRMQELDHMRDAVEKMASAAEIREVLQQIVTSAKEVLEADYALLWPYDEARHRFFPEELVAAQLPLELVEKIRKDEPGAGQTTRRVLDEGYVPVKDITLPEAEFIGLRTRESLEMLGVKSFQGICLDIGEDKLGVLFLDYKEPQSFSSEEERRVLKTFAQHAALALKKARLFDQVMRARQAARAVAELSTIGELTETMQAIVQSAKDVLRCDVVTLYTFDEEKHCFTGVAGAGYIAWANIRQPGDVTGESALWRVLDPKEPIHYLAADDAPGHALLKGHFVQEERIRSSLAILLYAAGRRVGVMFINYRTPHRFKKDEIDDARLFAHQAAVAIRNAQLHMETSKRAEVFQGLYSAGIAIMGMLSLDETLNEIVRQALRIVGASQHCAGCYGHVALRQGDKLRFVAASTPEILAALRQQIGEIDLNKSLRIGVSGRAVKTGKLQRIGDVSNDPDRTDFAANVRSRLSVPLKVEEQVIGVISVGHPERDVFTWEDQQNLELLAVQAAIAIRDAQLYAYMSSLYEASNQIISPGDPEQVLQEIVDGARQAIGAREATAYVFDNGKVPRILRKSGVEAGKNLAEYIRPNGVSIHVLRSGEPYFISDVTDLSLPIPPNPNMAAEGIKSGACLPMLLMGKNIGVLWVEFEEVHPFLEGERKALLLFATQSAIVYDNARQYDELRKTYEELKKTQGLVAARTAVAWMGMTSSVWRHSIQGDAITIQDLIKRISSDLPRGTFPKTEGSLKEIQDLTNKIIDRRTAPLSTEEYVESVAINGLLRERIKQLWEHDSFKSVSCRLKLGLQDGVTVRASSEWLKRVLDILIENAIEAMRESKVRRLTVVTLIVNGFVEIIITDTGMGIDNDTLSKLFQEPIKKPKGSKGLGVGLLMTQCIAQTYGGEIQLGNTGSVGTTMIMRFPVEV